MKTTLNYNSVLQSLPKEIRDEILTLPEDEKYEVLEMIAREEGMPIEVEDKELIHSPIDPVVVAGGDIKHIGGNNYISKGRKHKDGKSKGSGIKLYSPEGTIIYSDKLKLGHSGLEGPMEIMGKDMKGKSYFEVAKYLASAEKKVEKTMDDLANPDRIAIESMEDQLAKISAEREKLNHYLLEVDLPVKEQEEQQQEQFEQTKLAVAEYGKQTKKLKKMQSGGMTPSDSSIHEFKSQVPAMSTGVSDHQVRDLHSGMPALSVDPANEAEARRLLTGDPAEDLIDKFKTIVASNEGDGDNVTGIPTKKGITQPALDTFNKANNNPFGIKDPLKLSNEQALEVIKFTANKTYKKATEKFEGFETLPISTQLSVLDLAFNVGDGALDYKNLSAALRSGNLFNAALETFDTYNTTEKGKKVASTGILLRRIRNYNLQAVELGWPLIDSLEVKDGVYHINFEEPVEINGKQVTTVTKKPGAIASGSPKNKKYTGNDIIRIPNYLARAQQHQPVFEFGGASDYNYFDVPFYMENIPEAEYGNKLKRYQFSGTNRDFGFSFLNDTQRVNPGFWRPDRLPYKMYSPTEVKNIPNTIGLNNYSPYAIMQEAMQYKRPTPFNPQDAMDLNPYAFPSNRSQPISESNTSEETDEQGNPFLKTNWNIPNPQIFKKQFFPSIIPYSQPKEESNTPQSESSYNEIKMPPRFIPDTGFTREDFYELYRKQTGKTSPFQEEDPSKTPNQWFNDGAANNMLEAAYMARMMGEQVRAYPNLRLQANNPYVNMHYVDQSTGMRRNLERMSANMHYGTRGSGSNTANQVQMHNNLLAKSADIDTQEGARYQDFINRRHEALAGFENQLTQQNMALQQQGIQYNAAAQEAKRQQTNAHMQSYIDRINKLKSMKDSYDMMTKFECYKVDPKTKEMVFDENCAKIQYHRIMNDMNAGKGNNEAATSNQPIINIHNNGITPEVTSGKYGGNLKRPINNPNRKY